MLVLMLVMTLGFMHKSERSWEDFGLKRGPWIRWMAEGASWTLPVLALLTLLKAGVVAFMPEYGATSIFTALSEPFHAPTAIAYGVYVALVPIQEVMSRGALQGPLFQFLTGTTRSRTFWSILVSNALFGITHLHLTITLVEPMGIGAEDAAGGRQALAKPLSMDCRCDAGRAVVPLVPPAPSLLSSLP
jgi:hypothetical protein